MIIGVTGTAGAGKDTFARYLVEKGWKHLSLSDFIREEASERGLAATRDNLQNLGNDLREKRGLGALAEKARKKMRENANYVVTSIRNPAETKTLAEPGNFILVAVSTPLKTRFNRLQKRDGKKGSILPTLQEFKISEARELESPAPASQQLNECIAMADVAVNNDSDIKSFFRKIDGILLGLKTF